MENKGRLETRIKENIKNYSIANLFSADVLREYIDFAAAEYGVEILITNRHGEKYVSTGNFADYNPDIVKDAGEKLCIYERTIGHLYVRYDKVTEEKREAARQLILMMLKQMNLYGNEVYKNWEYMAYIDELEKKEEINRVHTGIRMKEDILTGVFTKQYLENRMNILDRAEIVPVAMINININDCKFVYDFYGMDKSDSLIQLVATILMQEAKAEYLIGRIGGDSFLVLIPLVEDGEAEAYAERVQKACMEYDDSVLSPSAAIGIIYKTNVEEKLIDKVSDAEYEMFNDKLRMKSVPGYEERLKKGLGHGN